MAIMPLDQTKEGLGQLYQTVVRLLSLIQARLFNQPAYFLNFVFIENVSSRSQGGTKGCPSTSLSSRDMREFKGKPVFQHISRNLKQSCLRCLPAVLQAMCCHSFLAVSNIRSRTLDLPVSTGNSGRVLVEERSHDQNFVSVSILCGKSHSLEQIQENSPWGKVLHCQPFFDLDMPRVMQATKYSSLLKIHLLLAFLQ